MPDLSFRVEGVEGERFAAEPLLRFRLGVGDAGAAPIHAVVLRCQIRIEPARRRYSSAEQARLLDLFGAPERWGQTLRPMLWAHAQAVVPPFVGTAAVDLPVPCSGDFTQAAVKYFDALEDGDIPLSFAFSGTVFYEGEDGALQAGQIPWEKEATYRLSAAAWKDLMNLYYPNSAWLCVRKDVFDRPSRYKNRAGLPTWERALERLLSAAGEPTT